MSESVAYFDGAAKAGQDEAVRAQSVSDDFDCRMSQFARCVEVLREERARAELWRTRANQLLSELRTITQILDEMNGAHAPLYSPLAKMRIRFGVILLEAKGWESEAKCAALDAGPVAPDAPPIAPEPPIHPGCHVRYMSPSRDINGWYWVCGCGYQVKAGAPLAPAEKGGQR